jgi:two-component system chemotaxis response regulator CheB
MTGPPQIRVLVVDDSVVVRRLVADSLAESPLITVVGVAHNGKMALEKVRDLEPDAVTMDIEMPVMDGIQAVRALRRTHPRLPVVMFSTLTERGAASTLDALAAGASDYVTKPSNVGSVAESRQSIRDQLIPKLVALTGARRLVVRSPAVPAPMPTARPRAQARTAPFEVLAIGSSTGGPDALATVLGALPGDLSVPVVIVQHMPPIFTRMLAERLDHGGALTIAEAVDGMPLQRGHVLIAPGGRHLEVRARGTSLVAHLTDAPPENYCRPAVDVLFRSVAKVFRDRTLAVVLTGMGRDGAQGATAIRQAGGRVLAQDEATSVVWGMPGAVVTAGQADQVLALQDIGASLKQELAGAPGRHAVTGVTK